MLSTLVMCLTLMSQAAPIDLRTVAEISNYRATARSDEVVALGEALAKSSKLVKAMELGKTGEGRPIPLWIVADPPVATPEEASRSGKLVVLILGNIHAGEVDGKEALPVLVRSLVEKPETPLLRDLILAVVPNYNPDGNDRFDKANRPGQKGPEEGMGQRANAAGLDLNRDFMKLDAPETRALLKFVRAWDPHAFIDTHTTNGSFHRYAITYDGPKSPAGDGRVVDYVRGALLPRVGEMFAKRTGRPTFFYGNFEQDHSRWTSFPALPRFSTTYFGLRNRISILSEAYSYDPYKTRIESTRDFVQCCLEDLAAHKAEIRKLLADARQKAEARGASSVAIRSQATASPEKVDILGFVEKVENGKTVETSEAKNYRVELVQAFRPTAEVKTPFAYLIPPKYEEAVAKLQRHGVLVGVLREDVHLQIEAYRIDSLKQGARREGHESVELETTPQSMTRLVEAGSYVVSTAQALGPLAVYLLEPASDDGLATWNAFDEGLAAGSEFPVLRLIEDAPLLTTPARPALEERVRNQPVTFESLRGSRGRGGFVGTPPPPRWLDGQSWLQARGNRLYRFDALTGRATPFFDPALMEKALKTIPKLGEERARAWSRQTAFTIDPKHQGALFHHENDLYYARFDGTTAHRLTETKADETHTSFSPDGQAVAFVRDNDLHAVDLATRTERPLSNGGNDLVGHGVADWVYGEEIFNRNDRAYWWSPDSRRVAFLEFNDESVPRHSVVNDARDSRRIEPTPYPRSGETNPKVRLGISKLAGGDVIWADLSAYAKGDFLISHVDWTPDGKTTIAYVQDRAQTWLDFVHVAVDDGSIKKLFRDTTKAWVESTGSPRFLADGSFLYLSERDGWKHVYHYTSDGSLKSQVTSGPWEVREVLHVDEAEGWIYFTSTRQHPMAVNLDRVKIAGGPIEAITRGEQTTRISFSPGGRLALATTSDRTTPPKVALLKANGERVRTVDANPMFRLEEIRRGHRENVTIQTRDGFPIEAEIVSPADRSPGQKYPVWLMTYAGPHMPTLARQWMGGDMDGEAIASAGAFVFRVDPRSASGKGAVSAWSAYKQLGVQELRDIEDAVAWLVKNRPEVDPTRIGMEGTSYGGYMTAYAMTHSGLFAAGIAGAPVTDWHDYDSIYTERYMGLPADNAEGYDKSSVVKAAKNLKGRLLIVHGAADDNVSVRNTMRLVQALQAEEKDFELMIYPGSRHGGFGPHYNRLRVDFIRRTLGLPPEKKP